MTETLPGLDALLSQPRRLIAAGFPAHLLDAPDTTP